MFVSQNRHICIVFFNNAMKTVHIGELIKRVAKERRLTDDEIGEGVNLSRTGVQRTYNETDMSTAKLRKFSEFLNYDFFAHLTDKTSSATFTTQGEFQEPLEKYDRTNMVEEVSLTFKVPKGMQQQILGMIMNQPA